MSTALIWSSDAVDDYHQNIEYLIRKWSEKVALQFIKETDDILELISTNPEIFPLVNYKNIRKAVLRKQITIFYEVRETEIILIRFWNNYQNPENSPIV